MSPPATPITFTKRENPVTVTARASSGGWDRCNSKLPVNGSETTTSCVEEIDDIEDHEVFVVRRGDDTSARHTTHTLPREFNKAPHAVTKPGTRYFSL